MVWGVNETMRDRGFGSRMTSLRDLTRLVFAILVFLLGRCLCMHIVQIEEQKNRICTWLQNADGLPYRLGGARLHTERVRVWVFVNII